MAIVRLTYKLSEGINYLDLAHGLSLTERRLIHQKQVFTVMGGMIVDDTTQTKVKISTAPNNFYTRNAVTRGFRAWKASRAKALEASGEGAEQQVAKYSDFKVRLDDAVSAYRRPFSAGSVEITAGEWQYSTIIPEQGVERQLKIVGSTHDSSSLAQYSLALGWLQTRAKPVRDPQMADLNSDGTPDNEVDFINTMFQDTQEDANRLGDISSDNNDSPFPYGELMTTQSTYSASEPRNLQLQFISHSGGANELNASIPGFQALCGLVRVDVSNSEESADPILIIDVETKGWNF